MIIYIYRKVPDKVKEKKKTEWEKIFVTYIKISLSQFIWIAVTKLPQST